MFVVASICVGLAISAIFFELALRIVDWPSPGLYQDGVGPLPLSIATDEGSSWRRYPGRARLRHWDYDIDVVINRDGFIERENAPKPMGVWRIGLFGDSFTAGMGVELDERFGRIWAASLSESVGRPIEVYNFGSAWSGTGQSAAFLEHAAVEYELDEIILALFGGNELQDNEYWEEYRSLSLDERRLRDQPRRSWRDHLRNRSRAAGFLYVSLVRGFASRQITVPSRRFVEEHWSPTERALDRFAALGGDRPMSLWYLPGTTEWDDKAWHELRSELDLTSDDRHAVRDRVRRWALDNVITFVDTTPYLAGESASRIRFPRDGHWNAAGHAIVGGALSRSPEASYWQRRMTSE